MSYANPYSTWATASGAAVYSSTSYSALTARLQGAVVGPADNLAFNTSLRQSSVVTTMLAQFIADYGPSDVLDDGNVANLEAQFIAALLRFYGLSGTGGTGGTGGGGGGDATGGVVLSPPSSNTTQTIGFSGLTQMSATGGTAPYAFSVTGGALPTGFSMGSAGLITGNASSLGSYAYSITATDSLGATGSASYILNIVNAVQSIALYPAQSDGTDAVGFVGGTQMSSSGGTAPYTYAITAGSLPTGLTISSSGLITGVASVIGSYAYTITATDSLGHTGSQAYTLNIVRGSSGITISPATSGGTAFIGATAGTQLAGQGGTAPYTYAVTGGSLPTGLYMNSSGLIAGTFSSAGSFSYTITATDSLGHTGSNTYTLGVVSSSATVTVYPASSGGTAILGTAAGTQVGASGGTSPYTYSVTAGSLPTGVSMSSGGYISGTFSAAGSYSYTITATDSASHTGSVSYTLTVAAAAPTITVYPSSSGGIASVGFTANTQVSASGGTSPYTYSVTAGALPTGLTMSSSGLIHGTSSGTGTFSYTITATDSAGHSGSAGYSLTVV